MMKVGDEVTYVDPHGSGSVAHVTAVVGAGPSMFKLLDLRVNGKLVEHVSHENDRTTGVGYWTLDKPVAKPRRPFGKKMK